MKFNKCIYSSITIFILFWIIISTAFAAPVPDTGQTKCYNDTAEIPCPTVGQDFYGQDGNYSINPMSYTKLDSSGNALPITATDWAMIKDNVTGLIWENNSHNSNWNNAPQVITQLNTAKFGGYSDWRLPTMQELGSIVDFSVLYPGPTINTNYFKNTFSYFYWSSWPYAFNANYAQGVEFANCSDYSNKKSYYNYVRAVRGGQLVIGSFDNLSINGDGTVTDSATGLIWQQATAKTSSGSSTMVWKDALSYCENLTLGGYSDWRLPTAKELRTILYYSQYPPSINKTVFKDTFSSLYWSSSTYASYYISYAWGVDFYYLFGICTYDYKNDKNYVRAVRGGQSGAFGNLVISPASRSVSNSAGTTTFEVSNTEIATSTMDWSTAIISGSDWLSISSGSSGSNSGTITCSYLANTTTSSRTSTIRVTATGATGNPQDLTVIQDAGGSKPTVQTAACSTFATNSATLNGTINPNGTSTTYYFQYGTSTSYGSVTPYADAGSGTTIKTVLENITGLAANTIYHFHLVGTNTAGTVYGGDQTFTTPQQSGSLKVTLSPADAISAGGKWKVDTGDWQNSDYIVSNLPVGTHTVSFKDVTGWTTPKSQTVTIQNGETTTVTETYTKQSGSLKVTLSPADAISAGGKWKVDTGDWQNSDYIVSNLPVGTHTVSFKDVTGWTTPKSQTVTIQNGETTTVTETYTKQFATTQPVPETGITKCCNDTAEIPCPTVGQDFYGQDGNYSINPMSYTKLDGSGNALPITATDWAMVKDNVTGLIWENNSHASTSDNAPQVITQLNTAKFGGYSDWRLPTMTELSSIVDFSIPYPGPTINISAFKDTFASFYLSSISDDRNGMRSVSFKDGISNGVSNNVVGYVRAVRGGQLVIGSLDNLSINGDGTVTDSATGLIWQQATAKTSSGSSTMVWKDALSYCENLTLGGYSDWRLPTVKELQTIVNYANSPAINIDVFKDTYASFYWSSSTYSYNNIFRIAWAVFFYNGIYDLYPKSNNYYVRAVRGGWAGSLDNVVLSVIPASQNISNSSGITSFAVSNTGTGTMPWKASVNPSSSWLRITSGSSGSNTGTVSCAYDANTTTSSRTGTITITPDSATGSPKTVTVTQAALPIQPVLSISPSSQNVSKDAGTTSFAVSNTGTGTMPWKASVNPSSSWLRITSGSSGSNTGTVSCAYDANTTTSSRTGTITITPDSATGSPKTVTVTQAPTITGSLSGKWQGRMQYCYKGSCQNETLALQFNSDNSWYGVMTLTISGVIFYYDLMGTYQMSGSSITGIGNSKLKKDSLWDSSQNIKFSLTKDNNEKLNGTWYDGSPSTITVKDLLKQ